MSDADLYPAGAPSLEMHDGVLRRHARRLATALEQDRAMAERQARLERELGEHRSGMAAKLDKVDREMGEQTHLLHAMQLTLAERAGTTKRWQIAATLLTPLLGALAVVLTWWLSHGGIHP